MKTCKMQCYAFGVATAALAMVALAGCDGELQVPERWALKEIGGEKLRSAFYCTHEWISNPKTAPKMRAFELAIPQFLAYPNNHMGPFADPEKRWKKPTYTFDDMVPAGVRAKIDAYERDFPGRPYWIHLSPYDFRSALTLPVAKADEASFLAWRATHPGFIGFRTYCETDAAYRSYVGGHLYSKRPGVREALAKKYPIFPDWERRVAQEESLAEGFRKAQFGCPDRYDLNSIDCTFAQIEAKTGSGFVFYEAELCVTSAPWRFGGLFTRGAARQWNVPWGWYMAHCVQAFDRSGKQVNGENKWPNKADPKADPYHGASRSLNRRNSAYGYFAGAAALQVENWHYSFLEDGPDGKPVPSQYAKDFNEIFDLDAKIDRGVPYTPCAFLVSYYEPFTRHGYNGSLRDPYSLNAFFWTLVPTLVENQYALSARKQGHEGCLWNSEFGEIGDAVCPDAGQPHGDFLAALRCYPVAVMVGWFPKDKTDVAAIAEYVEGGGRLYVTRSHVESGLAPSAGRHGRGSVVVIEDPVPQEFIDSADSYWSAKQKAVAAGRQTFPVYQRLLREIQGEYMPVTVEGDVQWGLNRTAKGWLVWLINNKGVTKYALEPQQLDQSATAHVTVTYKPTGRKYSAEVGPGDYGYIEIQ